MLNIRGNEIMRGEKPLGSIRGNDIFNHKGQKLGYVQGNHIYDANNKKLAWLEGDSVRTMDRKKFTLEDNHQHVEGGEVSDAHRAAVRFLLEE